MQHPHRIYHVTGLLVVTAQQPRVISVIQKNSLDYASYQNAALIRSD